MSRMPAQLPAQLSDGSAPALPQTDSLGTPVQKEHSRVAAAREQAQGAAQPH